MQKNHKNKKAFTLIELLIVIAIIGILSSVILVSLNSARDKAKKAKALSMAQNIQTALKVCMTSSTPDALGRFLAGCDSSAPREACSTLLNDGIPDAGLPICVDNSTSWVWPDFSEADYDYVNLSYSYSQIEQNTFFFFEIHKDGESTSLCCFQNACLPATYSSDGNSCMGKIIIPRPPSERE